MGFKATNFTVTTLLLMAFTVFIGAYVRRKRPLDNNWPLLYWMLVLVFALVRPEDTFNLSIILVGLAAGLLLRFEFMNRFMTNLVKYVEIAVWIYVIVRGFEMIT